jgi:hypothetical protein
MEMIREMFRSMNPSLIYDMQKYHPVAFEKFRKHKNEFMHEMVSHNLERGKREELYREEINIEIMTRYRIESMFIPFNPEFMKNLKASLLEIEEAIISHFLFGLVTPKGYKLILKYHEQREKLQNAALKK